MTVTIGSVPHRFFDGTWTHDRRDLLGQRVFKAIDEVLPGTSSRVLGFLLVAPPDIEEAIGRTEGDMLGGEIAPDQMLAMRPWPEGRPRPPRTSLAGLYVAGPSTLTGTLATCESGAAAARAAIADSTRRLFK